MRGKIKPTRAGWGLTGFWCLRDSELIHYGSELGVCLSMLLPLWLREWGDMSTTQRGGTYAASWAPCCKRKMCKWAFLDWGVGRTLGNRKEATRPIEREKALLGRSRGGKQRPFWRWWKEPQAADVMIQGPHVNTTDPRVQCNELFMLPHPAASSRGHSFARRGVGCCRERHPKGKLQGG